MVNEYAKALGIWEHKIGEIEHKLKPKKADNLAFARIISHPQNKENYVWVLEQGGELYKTMVLREYPLSEQDKKDLDEWIGLNLNKILEDMLVTFKWTTPEVIQEARVKQIEGFSQKKT